MKNFTYILLIALFLTGAKAFAIDVFLGSAVVDGNVAEWTSATFLTNMHRAWKTSKDVETKAYAKYDCNTNTLYIRVATVNYPIMVSEGDTYVKIGTTKIMDDDFAGNSATPQFAWVGRDGDYATGWEASCLLAPGTYTGVQIHNNIYDGSTQTSGIRDISITITCSTDPGPGSLDVEFSSVESTVQDNKVTIAWNAVEGSSHVGFNVLRSADAEDFTKLNSSLITAFFPGTLVEHTYEFVDELATSGNYTYKIEAIDNVGASSYSEPIVVAFGATSVEENVMPVEFALHQNYPNPFNPSTTISFTLAQEGYATLTIFDLTGKTVATLWDQRSTAGTYNVSWNGTDDHGNMMASGVYFYRLNTEGFNAMHRMTLIK